MLFPVLVVQLLRPGGELTGGLVLCHLVEAESLSTFAARTKHRPKLTILLFVLLDLLEGSLCRAVQVLAAVQGILDDRDCQQACARPHGRPAGGAPVFLVLTLPPTL